MEDVRRYILGLITAALVTAIVGSILNKKGVYAAVTKLACGVFMMLAVFSPLTDIRLENVIGTADGFSGEGLLVAERAKQEARESMAAVIKEQTEAYILDKAGSMGVQLSVEVRLDDSDIPVPVGVSISGSISPYNQNKLKQIISADLGIRAEEQIWH